MATLADDWRSGALLAADQAQWRGAAPGQASGGPSGARLGPKAGAEGLRSLLRQQQRPSVVDAAGWARIDAAEVAAGAAAGKPREKVVDWERALRLARGEESAG